MRAWLDELVRTNAPFGFPDGILMGFVRIVTQKPFDPVTPIDLALEHAERLRALPSCTVLAADSHQWDRFVQVATRLRAQGKQAQDVYWASFALAHDAEWVTFDGGFSQIPGLRWRSPFDPQPRTNPR